MPRRCWRADQADFGQKSGKRDGDEPDGSVVREIEPVRRALVPGMPIVARMFGPRTTVRSISISGEQLGATTPSAVCRISGFFLELGGRAQNFGPPRDGGTEQPSRGGQPEDGDFRLPYRHDPTAG